MRRGPYFSYRPGGFGERIFGADTVATLRRELNRVFDELELPKRGSDASAAKPAGASTTSEAKVALDLTETAEKIVVCADLPGVEEQDVDVTLDEDQLTIRAERKVDRAREEGRLHVSERAAASYSRRVRLPSPVDPDAVQAEFKNGVLTVTLPKPKPESRGRKIPVGGANADAAPPSKGDAFVQGDGAIGPTPSTGVGADVENAAKPGGAVHGYNE